MTEHHRPVDTTALWPTLRAEATQYAEQNPLLADFYRRHILQHDHFAAALAWVLTEKLADHAEQHPDWHRLFADTFEAHPSAIEAALRDLICQVQSNASVKDHCTPLLHFGSFQALQAYRLAHAFWQAGNPAMATYLQGRMVCQFGVDIHPAAVIGSGIFFDHAVGIVIGETAVVEDDVTLFQSVTLGGTGKGSGDRHPKIRRGSFIGSGAVVLGNIEVGPEARVAAGAVVVKPVPPNKTMAGAVATEVQPRPKPTQEKSS